MRIGPLILFERQFIGGREDPYMIRHIIAKCPWFGVCIHKFCRSDYEHALHDHPWWFVSLVLRGGYMEEWAKMYPVPGCDRPAEVRFIEHRRVGSIAWRPASWRHRVMLFKGVYEKTWSHWNGEMWAPLPMTIEIPAWTFIIMGPRVRRWGFWMPDGSWCWWRRHNPTLNICEDHPIHAGGDD